MTLATLVGLTIFPVKYPGTEILHWAKLYKDAVFERGFSLAQLAGMWQHHLATGLGIEANGRLVGCVVMEWVKPGIGSVHGMFDYSVWGTGIPAESSRLAIKELFARFPEMRKIQLTVQSCNRAARKLVVEIGAKQEGILRGHWLTENGQARDVVVFGLMRDEVIQP